MIQISIQIPKDMLKRLDNIAKRTGCSRTNLIKMYIDRGLETNGKPN